MATSATRELRRERDRRWDAGENIAEIDADFRARGIDPDTFGPLGSAEAATIDPAVIEAVELAFRRELKPVLDRLDAAITRLEARYGKVAPR